MSSRLGGIELIVFGKFGMDRIVVVVVSIDVCLLDFSRH